MKQLIIALCLVASFAQAQVSQRYAARIYRVGDQLVISDSIGTNQTVYPFTVAQIVATNSLVRINISGLSKYYQPAKILNSSGVAYSTTSTTAAVAGILATVPDGTIPTDVAQIGGVKLTDYTADKLTTAGILSAKADTSTTLRKVADVAALAAINVPTGYVYVASLDRVVKYNPANGSTVDNVTVFAATGRGSGRYEGALSYLNVQKFYFLQDGANWQPAIQRCFDYITDNELQNICVEFPPFNYTLNTYQSGANILTLGSTTKSVGNVLLMGNGATLTTTLASQVLTSTIVLQGNIKHVSIIGLDIINNHAYTTNATAAVRVDGGKTQTIGSLTVERCLFKNHSRTFHVQGIRTVLVNGNRFLYDLGHDSGTGTNTEPNVGFWAFSNRSGYVGTVQLTNNYWNGAVTNTVATTVSKRAMDGFAYGAALSWHITDNVILNHQYEAIYTALAYPNSSAITSAVANGTVVTVNMPKNNLMVVTSTFSNTLTPNVSLGAGAKFNVFISGVTSMTGLNGRYLATLTGDSTFTINTKTVFTEPFVAGNGIITDQFYETSTYVSNNTINSNIVDGTPYFGTYSIRCDGDNATIVDNNINSAGRGIMVYGVGQNHRIQSPNVSSNKIRMASDPMKTSFAINITKADFITVHENHIIYDKYQKLNIEGNAPIVAVAIVDCQDGLIDYNRVEARSSTAGSLAAAFNIANSGNLTLDYNKTKNFAYSIKSEQTNTDLIYVNNHESTGDSVICRDPGRFFFYKQTVRFVPSTTNAYYRILNAIAADAPLAGRLTVGGYFNNRVTNQVFEVTSMGSSSPNNVTMIRNQQYNGGGSQVQRILIGEGTVDLYLVGIPASNTGVMTVTFEQNNAKQVNGTVILATSPIISPAAPTGTTKELYTNRGTVLGTTGAVEFQGSVSGGVMSGTTYPGSTVLFSGLSTLHTNTTAGQTAFWHNNGTNIRLITPIGGLQTITGDGTTTTFSITHGLPYTPTIVQLSGLPYSNIVISASTISFTTTTVLANAATAKIYWTAR